MLDWINLIIRIINKLKIKTLNKLWLKFIYTNLNLQIIIIIHIQIVNKINKNETESIILHCLNFIDKIPQHL